MKVINKPYIETRPRRISGGHRVVFLYPYKMEFAAAARALKIRGLIDFGLDPIPGRWRYMAFYADITQFDAETYGQYAMLVRDFYGDENQARFNALFPGLDHKAIPASIHNPNAYMEAQRPLVEALIEKYKDTTCPLIFYDSKHMAEGVAMLLGIFKHPELKGAILADEQGMAKTIQCVVAAVEGGKKRVLVVSTKSGTAITWPDEIPKVPGAGKIFYGEADWLGPASYQWVLIAWDTLRRFKAVEKVIAERRRKENEPPIPGLEQALVEIKELASQFDLLIIDEGHFAQDEESQRSIGLDCFAENIQHLIVSSGTPLPKRPRNILNLFRLIKHPLAKDPEQFLARYEGDKDDKGDTIKSKQRLDELHHLLRDCYIRREKSQTNLPPKTRPVHKITLDEKDFKKMDEMWFKFCKDNAEDIAKNTYPIDSVKTGQYHKYGSILKAPKVADWAEDHVVNGRKVVLFTNYTEVYNYWMKRFGKLAAGIDGSVDKDKRVSEYKRFQNDPKCMFMIGNVIAAGESITCTAAYLLAFNDITNRPKDMLQAEDRIHRGGQHTDCECHYFIANTEQDQLRFDRFVSDKEVVQSVVNRRNADGTINDAEWTGELEGTAAERQGSLIKTSFDWEDAGMEPPVIKKKKETLAEMPEYKRKMIQTRQAKLRAIKEGVTVARDLGGICSQLETVLPHQGSPRAVEFIRSITDQYRQRGSLTDKQRAAAIQLLERNIHHLRGR